MVKRGERNRYSLEREQPFSYGGPNEGLWLRVSGNLIPDATRFGAIVGGVGIAKFGNSVLPRGKSTSLRGPSISGSTPFSLAARILFLLRTISSPNDQKSPPKCFCSHF